MSSAYDPVSNTNGDSWLNMCLETNKFFSSVGVAYTAISGWSEPYPLLVLVLIMLIVLPSIFGLGSKSSFMKISRIYNFIRLGTMSILHQIGYSYTFATPLSLFINQGNPCMWGSSFEQGPSLKMFPSPLMTSAAMFSFAVARFSGVRRWISFSIATLFLTLNVILIVASTFNSVFQAVCTIFMSYILHFIHIHIPFKYIHLENVFWCVLIIVCALFCIFHEKMSLTETWFELWFGIVVIIVDEIVLIRYHMTRGGFSSIERPADIYWSVEVPHTESIRLLNSEEEDNFAKNMSSDVQTSTFAFLCFFLCVLLRRVLVPKFFSSV